MITVPYKRINKYQFLIPCSLLILFILHSPESSDKNLIIIHNFSEPSGIHDKHLLAQLIYDFLFVNIFKRRAINSSKLSFWNNQGLDFDVSFNSNIHSYKVGYRSNCIFALF